jgi:hypothetical protein
MAQIKRDQGCLGFEYGMREYEMRCFGVTLILLALAEVRSLDKLT